MGCRFVWADVKGAMLAPPFRFRGEQSRLMPCGGSLSVQRLLSAPRLLRSDFSLPTSDFYLCHSAPR
jgi:hypothetical protein